MKRLILALALVAAIAAGCDRPQPTPMQEGTSVELAMVVGDTTGVADSLRVAMDRVQWAMDRDNGYTVNQLFVFGNGSGVQLWLRRPLGDVGLIFTIYEPAHAWGDTLLCHEGKEQDGSFTPIGTCGYTNEHYQMMLRMVLNKLDSGQMTRVTENTHQTGSQTFGFTWEGSQMDDGPWKAALGLSVLDTATVPVEPVPYLYGKRRPKSKYNYKSTETGRGEQ